jgi:subtilisin family serine protease
MRNVMLRTWIIGAGLCALLAGSPAMAGSVSAAYKGNSGSGGGGTVAAPVSGTPGFQAGSSSAWFNQIGLTGAVESQANQGAGITIGIVDTGVVSTNPEISGRVSGLSSCAAVTFVCSRGVLDDNGHGTATASIAAGLFNSSDMMSGVAPSATILSEKVLNASGVGYDTDVANGIMRAANGGSQVISLSLGYIPSSAVIDAINYATNKGAVIVWAGGNASTSLNSGRSTTGLTTTALSHIVFVGSVNSGNTVSYFSNRPGTGAAIAGATSASYASLWLMAPGENILAPATQYGSNSYAYWSGTSMSAPEVAGALALLEATWPVLQRNGTATAVLFASATDLGAKGVDSTYGNGLMNLTKAFQSIGVLSVTTASGGSIPVSQGGGATMASGALGSLASVKSILSNYTTFDTYQRNFTTNLSRMVGNQSSLANVMAGQAAAPVSVTSSALPGGGHLTLAASDTSYYDASGAQALMLSQRTTASREPGAFYLSMTSRDGSTVAVGRGLPSTAAFANALWGEGGAAAYQVNELGVSNALMGYAQGGYFGSIGANLGARARLGLSWTSTPERAIWAISPDQTRIQSSAAAVGVTFKLTGRLTAGVTFAALGETNSLLGSSYDPHGLLSLGAAHRSTSVGLSSAYDLGGGRGLLFDAVFAKISGSSVQDGLIASVSPMTARAYGVSFVQADAFRDGDRLTLSIRKPLRVVSGSVQLAVTNVDDQGYPTTSLVRANLKPNGSETDIGVGYAATFRHGLNLTTGLAYRSDAYNVKGLGDVDARVSLRMRF